MNTSKLRNKFLKTRNEESKWSFNRQINFCFSLLGKTKILFWGETRPQSCLWHHNRKFWKTIRPVLLEKAFHKKSIILNVNNKTISNNENLAEILNKLFSKLVENVDIDKILASNIASSGITDSVFNAIRKYEYHPSVKKKHFMDGKDVNFSFIFEPKKKRLSPSELKNADVIPVFKKKDRNNVENYRQVNILPNLLKIYERWLYNQMYKYFNHILSNSNVDSIKALTCNTAFL